MSIKLKFFHKEGGPALFQRKRRSLSFWAGLVGACFMLAFFVIIGRFVYIAQGKEIEGHKLMPIAKNQWSQYKVIDEKRGTIYSANGRILAEDVPAYTLFAVTSPNAGKDRQGNLRYVKDKEKTARLLAPVLGMKESDMLNRLNKNAYQVEFGSKGRMLSYEKKKQIDKLGLPGIGYLTESRRYYPEQGSAAYTIGFTQTDSKTKKRQGAFGIEQSLDRYLSEKDGTVRYYKSVSGVPIPDEHQRISKSVPGNDAHLTINSSIQTVLEQAMTRVNKEYTPESMVGVVADPKTGKILAMSSLPGFNPNKRDIKQFSNSAISDPYEPGSVMKTFTVASAIDAGVYNGQATYPSGDYKTKGGTIHDWHRGGWGTITFNQGFELSSNVGMSVLTDKYIGPDRLGAYFKKFGLMKKTGIDLPGERSSLVNWTWPIDKLEASFGQASAFTAIQIVQAATAIANDGKMMRPYVVDKVVNPETKKTVVDHQPVVAGQPISPQAAEQTRSLLRRAVSAKDVVKGYNATGVAYDLPGYDVIGKTGTAQVAVDGQYLPGKNNYIYSFLGMAPEKDPKLIVYVAVKQPQLKPTDLGAEPVEQIVRPVMASSLQYMQVRKASPKSGDMGTSSEKVDNYTGQPITEAEAALKNSGLNPVSAGTGTVSKQVPAAGDKAVKGSRVILLGSGSATVPDLSGWSLADSMKFAEAAGMKLKVQGNGFVTEQKPKPGSRVKGGSDLTLQLSPHQPGPEQKETTEDAKSSSNQPEGQNE